MANNSELPPDAPKDEDGRAQRILAFHVRHPRAFQTLAAKLWNEMGSGEQRDHINHAAGAAGTDDMEELDKRIDLEVLQAYLNKPPQSDHWDDLSQQHPDDWPSAFGGGVSGWPPAA